MSDDELRRFRKNTRLASLLLSRVAPLLAKMGDLLDDQRREKKLLERIWGGLWVVAGVIALLSWLQIVDESALYYPGIFIGVIFLRQWLVPFSRVELDLDAVQRRAFPILLRLEELGLSDRTIFSWLLNIGEVANEEQLRACRNLYFGSDDHPLADDAGDIEDLEQDIPLNAPTDDEVGIWLRAQLEIARKIRLDTGH